MILGPLVETPANVERVKRNWRAGGREGLLARWRKRDELPWAYWRCDVPRKLFNQARKHYQTDAAADGRLGIAPPDIPPVKSSSL